MSHERSHLINASTGHISGDLYDAPSKPSHGEHAEEEEAATPGLFGGLKRVLSHGLLPHGSIASSGFNLAAATLGAGTLSMPSAVQQSGVVIGVVSLALTGIATVVAIRFLILVLQRTNCNTYESIARHLVGVKFEKATALLIVLFCFSITFVYVKGIMDILNPFQQLKGMPKCFQGEWGLRFLTTIFWALFMLPLSLTKEINSLRYASMIGMMATTFLVIAVIVHAALDGTENFKTNLTYAEWNLPMITSLPVFIFGYCCQTNAFEIYTELKNATPNRMTLAAGVSMFCCTLLYIAVSIAGFGDFGANVAGNILRSYVDPTKTAYILISYLCIAVTLTMAFPICIFPTRDAILQLLHYENAYVTPTKVRLGVCASLAVVSLVIGLFVPGLKFAVTILGGVCGAPLAFIWPGYFYLKAFDFDRKQTGWVNMVVAWLLIIVGGVFGALGVVVSIVQKACPACIA